MAGIKNKRATGLTIGTLSKLTGCNIETIRFYEKQGLIPTPPRTEGGHRVYETSHLERLSFIRRSRELGFTLNEVRALLRLADGHHTCAEVQTMAREHLASMRRKIADLQRLERILADVESSCIGGNVPECPILESLFSGLPEVTLGKVSHS